MEQKGKFMEKEQRRWLTTMMRERKQTRNRKVHESRDGERSRALCGEMAAMRNRKGKRDQLEEEVRGVRCVDEWRC